MRQSLTVTHRIVLKPPHGFNQGGVAAVDVNNVAQCASAGNSSPQGPIASRLDQKLTLPGGACLGMRRLAAAIPRCTVVQRLTQKGYDNRARGQRPGGAAHDVL